MGQSRDNRNQPPRPPSRPARSGGRPPRPAPAPPRSSRPRPEEEWDDEQETPTGQPPARPGRPGRPRPLPPLSPTDDDDAEDAPGGPDPLDDPRAPRNLRRSTPEPRRARPRDFDDFDGDESAPRERDQRGARYDRRPPASPNDSYGDSYDGGDSYGDAPAYDRRGRGPSRPRQYPEYPDERSARGGRDGGGRGGRRSGGRMPYDDADVYSEWERPGRGPSDRDERRGRYNDQYNDPRNRPARGSHQPSWRDAASQWLSAAVPVPLPRRKSKRVPVVLLLLIVLVALAVPGVLFGPTLLNRLTTSSAPYHGLPGTYTPGPTPPARSGFKKYVSARANYSMDYPQAWAATKQDQTTDGQPDYIDVFAPASPTGSSMLIEQPGTAASTADADIISGEVAGAQQNGVTFTATSSFPIQVNIGGEFWQRQDYLVSGSGPTSHEAILAGHHEGHAYVIVLMSGADTFSQDAAAIFTPALTSFRFNS